MMPQKKKRFGWPTIVGVIITIPILWWSLRGIHFGEVYEYARSARKLPLVATMVAVVLALPARAARWRTLLRHERLALPLLPLYHATAAGFAINNILPARAGEIARAYAAQRLTGVRFSSAITTIVLSRIFDGITLFLVLAFASFVGWLSPDFVLLGVTVSSLMQGATVVFVGLFAVALIAIKFPAAVLAVGRRFSHMLLPRKWAERPVQGLQGILDSLVLIGSLRTLSVVMGWSAVVWGLNGLSFFLAFIAFGLDVPWHAALVVQSLINFGLAIPSTPGFVGVFEALTRASLSLYGVPAAAAISYGVAYHFCSYVPITLAGLWSLARAQIRMREVQEEVHERVSGAVQRVSVMVERMTGVYQRIDE